MRPSIPAFLLCLVLTGPALALGPDPVHPTPEVAAARVDAPMSRAERWRGTPYTRSETDVALRQSRNRTLLRDTDLTAVPTLQSESDLLRREALDKRMPVAPFSGNSSSGVIGF